MPGKEKSTRTTSPHLQQTKPPTIVHSSEKTNDWQKSREGVVWPFEQTCGVIGEGIAALAPPPLSGDLPHSFTQTSVSINLINTRDLVRIEIEEIGNHQRKHPVSVHFQ